MLSDIFLISALILLNGFFAAAEMALLTVRKMRLKALSENGDQRADTALHIQDNPGDFLSTVQIGITLVGTAASAIGGVGIVRFLTPQIARIPKLAPYAEGIALTGVIILIAYFTLVVGELVPKRLALLNSEKIALNLSGPLSILSKIAYLPMRLLSGSTEAVLKLIGAEEQNIPSTSPEEIELLVKQGAAEGVIQSSEEKLISSIFDYTTRRLYDVMTPRTEIIAFDEKTLTPIALEVAKQIGYSRYPVYQDNIDQAIGFVHIKDLIWASKSESLGQFYRPIRFIPSNSTLPAAFDLLTETGSQIAIVVDEFGGTHGLLTLEDLLEEIVGEIEDEHSPVSRSFVRESEGEWIVLGQTPILEISELLKVKFQSKGQYKTIAGFIMKELGFIPVEGDKTQKFGYTFIVKKRENLRIAEVKITRKNLADIVAK
ncbi:MAG: HlyC/CorC family transporter [Anaerolineae bacterium]|jgi:putative hemolysin|nr:HlyC/CorC family transporter [Anaerolineae bacterium]MBT7075440.1 HlyC/CorC family transporter [Anaerolineae bacterium]MBT7781642.1 HlyC/CorC family transporter [Anaerolineae bacterium]